MSFIDPDYDKPSDVLALLVLASMLLVFLLLKQ